jgi:hypothetical protein
MPNTKVKNSGTNSANSTAPTARWHRTNRNIFYTSERLVAGSIPRPHKYRL